jgi:hypothetical protein
LRILPRYHKLKNVYILLLVLYGCGTNFCLMEITADSRSMGTKCHGVYLNRRDRRWQETEKLLNYSSKIIRVNNSRRLRWAGNLSHIWYMKEWHRFVRRNEGKRPLGRPGYRWENYIKMGIKDIILDSVSSVSTTLWMQYWNFELHKTYVISWPAGWPQASEEWLYFSFQNVVLFCVFYNARQ